MDYTDVEDIVESVGLGSVYFETKIAKNTSQEFEIDYVYVGGSKELFCKRQPSSLNFYLCNDLCNQLQNWSCRFDE